MTKVEKVLSSLNVEPDYRLTKIEYNNLSMVSKGESVEGKFELLEHEGRFMIKVWANQPRMDLVYIRTSPVQKILDCTSKSITFSTMNSVYILEELS